MCPGGSYVRTVGGQACASWGELWEIVQWSPSLCPKGCSVQFNESCPRGDTTY